MNHSGDTNKMVDTPRTDDRVVSIDGNPWVNAPFARGLERELAAAQQRIKQLEAVVNDPEVLWSNWLRGTVELPSGIGDVRQYQVRIQRLEEAGDALCINSDPTRWDSLQAANRKLDDQEEWRKAKEDKP